MVEIHFSSGGYHRCVTIQGSPNYFVRGPHELSHSSPRAGHLT